jgi:protein gp37
MGAAKYQTDGDPRTSGPGFGVSIHPAALDIPRRWRTSRLVFVNSMSDLFHAQVPNEFVGAVLTVIRDTPQHTYQVLTKRPTRARRLAAAGLEFPPNLWLGVSVESTEQLHRVEQLRAIPATTKFLSCEPLLGPLTDLDLAGINWLIAGGESGPGARLFHVDWLRDLRDLCVSAHVPFFFKQWGGRTPKSAGRILDGRIWDQMPEVTR